MRFVLIALVFSLLCSGFSAAHAFGSVPCHSSGTEKRADMAGMAGCDDCPDHESHKDKADSTKSKKSEGAKKQQCASHCCASHAMALPHYSFDLRPRTAVLNPSLISGCVDGYLFSLLRPPKSLV